jgi:hypothetical protein
MATETAAPAPFISSLKEDIHWNKLRLNPDEKIEAKAFCYKYTSGINDIVLKLLLIVALGFHAYNYMNASRLMELAPTVEKCTAAQITDLNKNLKQVKQFSLVGLGIMMAVILFSNTIEMMDIRFRGAAHILVSIVMLVIFILDLIYLGKVKTTATACVTGSTGADDLAAFKKIVSDMNMWSGVGIGASVLWMGFYGYRIYADTKGLGDINATNLVRSGKAAIKK